MTETEKTIIRSAKEQFVSKGFFNTNIPDIVSHSGVSTGSIYHYFGSKQKLAEIMYDLSLKSFLSALDYKFSMATDWKEKIRGVIELLFFLAEEDQTEIQYLLFMNHREIQRDFVPICFSDPFQAVQSVLSEAVGKKYEGDIKILTAAFMGMPIKVIELKLNGAINDQLEEKIDEVASLAFSMIKNAKEEK